MRSSHSGSAPVRGILTVAPLIWACFGAAGLVQDISHQNVLISPADEYTLVSEDTGHGQGSPLDDTFRQFVEGHLEKWHIPGMAIAVIDGDQTWAEGYGLSALPSTPMSDSSLFYTGSTTKAFTASILAMMVDSGNYSALKPLGIKTPIASIVPGDFVLQDPWNTAHLTLEDALSHRTGYGRHDLSITKRYPNDDDDGSHDVTPRDLTRALRHLPQVLEPRTEFRYCNLMFIVASHVIETVTGGRWLGETLRDRIWRPLGMDDTYFDRDEALRGGGKEEGGPKVATGYWWDYPAELKKEEEEEKAVSSSGNDDDDDGDRRGGRKGSRNLEYFHEAPKQPSLGLSGAGGIISNVVDYAKWVRCLLTESEPLTKPVHAAIKQHRMVVLGGGAEASTHRGFDAPTTYSLGLNTGTYKGHRVFFHGGGVEAYGTEVFFFPDLNYGVVTMANTAGTSNVLGEIVAWQLIDDKLGVPQDERWDWVKDGETLLQSKITGKSRSQALRNLFPEHFPPSPSPSPLPTTLPLPSYTGTYHHPAYQNLTILLSPSSSSPSSSSISLYSPRGPQSVWETTWNFQHVSGEFFFVTISFDNADNGLMSTFARAEFHVGPSGKVVDALSLEHFEDGSEGVIRFERVSSSGTT